MTPKEFIKLTRSKSIITIITFLFIFYVPIIKVQVVCITAPCNPFYNTISIILHEKVIGFFGTIGQFLWPIYSYLISESLFTIFLVIIPYLISCLIIYLISLIKKRG